MNDDERDAAVRAHLDALDAEIERLHRMEAAMDRRIAAAEAEKRAIEAGPRPAGGEGDEQSGG